MQRPGQVHRKRLVPAPIERCAGFSLDPPDDFAQQWRKQPDHRPAVAQRLNPGNT